MALIRLNNATVSYEGDLAAENVSFSVEKGDYLVILGENGSGKSTVMKAMLGLVKLKSGEVIHSDGLKKNGVGYLPQQTRIQRDFPASVEEVVQSGVVNRLGRRLFPGREEKQRARQQMERLEIWEMRKKPYRALSGGQQQRVLLARALCATDSLLLLDEPVTGLDPETTAEMYEIIRNINRQGVAIVTVSHDVGQALRDAKHVLVMERTVRFYGETEAYEAWRRENG
ncbi:MAG: metal ABC transporter ATP-binding protein [Clostridiales bacterium]|nr:metal ABC transporter ATP-binding protein [Clostridiales bacterium]